jgi:hypothetical protein
MTALVLENLKLSILFLLSRRPVVLSPRQLQTIVRPEW